MLSKTSFCGSVRSPSINVKMRMVDDMGQPENLKYDTAQISIGVAVVSDFLFQR